MMRGPSAFNVVAVVLGLLFLYAPIVLLIVYSFNASKLVGVWAGFSVRWYGELLRNQAMIDAAWMSLRIALVSSALAAVLGTLAAIVLVRYRSMRGWRLFSALLYVPLVLPEVITGLSFLLLFVAAGIERGFWTIVFAHVSLAMCFVAVTVQARLQSFDMALEEAAIDLGCSALRAFMRVTLPLIAPAIAAGWLLAFIISMDNLVISTFVAGPGATTLPMRVYSSIRLGVSPEINALSTILIAFVICGALGFLVLVRYRAGSGRALGGKRDDTCPDLT